MSLQSIAIQLVLVFVFVVFYFHYLQYVNHSQYSTNLFTDESSLSSHPIAVNRANNQNQQRYGSKYSFQDFLKDLNARKPNISSEIKPISQHRSNNKNIIPKSDNHDRKDISPLHPKDKGDITPKSAVIIAPKQSDENKKDSSIHKKANSKSTKSDNSKIKGLSEKVTEFAKPNEMINNFTPAVGPDLKHPKKSPREGTEIDNEQQKHEVINCSDQSNCIVPALQLLKKFNVYLCKPPKGGGGVRFMYLVREGLLTHPNIQFMSTLDVEKVDYIVYLPGSGAWDKTECNNTYSISKQKVIVLDEFDGPTPLYIPYPNKMDHFYGKNHRWYYMYFKRSFVYRHDGIFRKYPFFNPNEPAKDIYPMTYPLAEAYVRPKFNMIREIDILCTLRGSKAMTTRLRVQNWIKDYVQEYKVANAITKSVNKATRTSINKAYFEHMHNTKIIVTVNPADWEGDFRLWESLASGALVFVDHLFVPHPFPLLDGVHIVYYDNHNKTELYTKLQYYLSHPNDAQKIAINGYLYAMKYHRAVNLIDYVFYSTHLKHQTEQHKNIPKYIQSAQLLNYEARRQEKDIKKNQLPGHYNLKDIMYNHTHLVSY